MLRILLYLLVGTALGDVDLKLPSTFYENAEMYEYTCSVQFSRPMNFDCACVNGVWVLYDSCNEDASTKVSGKNNHCTKLSDVTASKAVQILKSTQDLALLTTDGVVKYLEADSPQEFDIDHDSKLVTGSDWTLVEKSGARICLSMSEPGSYCYFSNSDNGVWSVTTVEPGCDMYDYFVDPNECHQIGTGNNPEICEEAVDDHDRVKRASGQQGRVFFGSPGQDYGNSSDSNSTAPSGNSTIWLPMDSEDFFNDTAVNKTEEVDSIATEIWNFVDTKLDHLLGLEKKKPVVEEGKREVRSPGNPVPDISPRADAAMLNVAYSNPVYEFLDIAKRIMQKTCPPYYVKSEFLDLAVASFIRIQQIHFKFPESSFKPASFRRVLNNLRRCEDMSAPFNFTNAECDGKVNGNFSAFRQKIELTITDQWAPKDRDPIVETVWKVFFNAHSACYDYFNGSYNDHHRFTTWMLPLFQNQMNDLWLRGKTTENSLSGLFGNQLDVQGNLAYCAASSRLESKYPWDLPRPARILRYGKQVNFTIKGRKKRDLELDVDYYYPILASGTCIDSNKPSLCPFHIKSISQQ